MDDSDDALADRSRSGDRVAFEQLVRRTGRLLFARLYLDTGDPHEAEDLTQETFLVAHRQIHRLQDPARFRAWIFSIARTVHLDAIKSRSRKKRRLFDSTGADSVLTNSRRTHAPDSAPNRSKSRGAGSSDIGPIETDSDDNRSDGIDSIETDSNETGSRDTGSRDAATTGRDSASATATDTGASDVDSSDAGSRDADSSEADSSDADSSDAESSYAGSRDADASDAESSYADARDADTRKAGSRRGGFSSAGSVDLLHQMPSSLPGPAENAEMMEQRQKVLSALRELPEDYQRPLSLRYLAGSDYDTISRQLGLTNGSLRGLLHRGLEMLREKIKPD